MMSDEEIEKDELDDDLDLDLDDDSGFEDFNGQSKSGTLGELWANPLIKIGVIVIAVIIVFFIVSSLGGKTENVETSRVGGGSDVTVAPGTEDLSPAYKEAIEQSNEEAVEAAFATGGSALPVPTDLPVGRIEPEEPEDSEPEEDPLERWKRLQEERLQEETLQATPDQLLDVTQVQQGPDPAIEALSSIMSDQMQTILESQSTAKISYRSVTSADYLRNLAQEQAMTQAEQIELAQQGQVSTTPPLISAGEILYAQLITEANSDVPGPILAQIAGGKYSGARLLGDFEVQEELLTLNFNTIVIDGEAVPINAVAVDPATTLPAMATKVDHRYLKRVILPAAAAFVEGAAEAFAESGRTTITIDGGAAVETEEEANTEQQISTGVREAGAEIRDILDDMADDAKVLVVVESGTAMGILFTENVIKQTPQQVQQQLEEENNLFNIQNLQTLQNYQPNQLLDQQ